MRAIYHKNRLINELHRLFYATCVWVMDLPDNVPKFLRYSKMELKERASNTFHILLFFGAYALLGLIDLFRGLRYRLRDKVL
ncbi:MAG: hypothetical protein WCV69_03665 [Patescibacteria group bacterium]|jgi:hypothetical protein